MKYFIREFVDAISLIVFGALILGIFEIFYQLLGG